VAADAFQSGALRVRFPRAADTVPEAVLLNTAGGLTGGDSLSIQIALEPGAEAIVASQACEKIYRASSGDVRLRTDIRLADDAALDYLPQPTIVFDKARLHRETKVHLDERSRFLGLEAAILGRTAMAEEFRDGALRDVWMVRRASRLVFADALMLTSRLSGPWALDQARAYANLIYAAPDSESRIDEMRKILRDGSGVSAASAWNGLLVTRFMARDYYTLMQDLARVLRAFRGRLLPRLWSI
jgi:urease accessory protein